MKVKIIDGVPISFARVVVLNFKIDMQDPEIEIADYIDKWRRDSAGQWASEHCIGKFEIHRLEDPCTFSTLVRVVALMSEKNSIYYNLKWK